MKKLLCVLMFGMVFGEVSQRVIDVTIESGSTTNLDELFPDYDLEWAIINIIGCSNDHYFCDLKYESWDNSRSSLTQNSDDFSYIGNNTGSFFAGKNDGLQRDFIISTQLGGTSPIKLLVTAEFPEEDTGYIEEGFDYCIEEGANLIASPCKDTVPILDTIPFEIANNLTGIIGQGVASTNQGGTWMGSLDGLGGGNGYWFQSTVNACFNYNCAEN